MPRSRKRFLVQNGGSADIEVARARGNYVYDTRGRKYIDFIMGWCVGNFGWAQPSLRRRVHAFDVDDIAIGVHHADRDAPFQRARCSRGCRGNFLRRHEINLLRRPIGIGRGARRWSTLRGELL